MSNIPFSYNNTKKLTFLSKDEKYPRHYRILTPVGDTAYVRSGLVSADQELSHAQIKEEIDNGLRPGNQGRRPEKTTVDLPRWASWAVILSIIVFLYLLWKKYYLIENWFCRKSSLQPKRLSKPWFITYSLVAGGGSSKSGDKTGSSSEPSGSIKTVDGQRYIKTDSGRWDNF
ncbi:MAG TPA: hypothetical protein DIS74_04655 [Bacteroidales bacterium]|nr:hypothetical protein [Bacteroidales bacterium]